MKMLLQSLILFVLTQLCSCDAAQFGQTQSDEHNSTAFKYMYHGSMQVVPRLYVDYELQSTRHYVPFSGKGPVIPHKPLLPLDYTDYIIFGVGAIGMIVAAGGGIGGGGVMVPLLIIFGGFTTLTGVALSNVTVMGGAFANLVINYGKRHPYAERPLIDWDLIMVMEGTTIFGAIFGGYMNKILPSWITGTILVLLLSQMGWVLLRKGIRMRSKETAEMLKEKEPLLSDVPVSGRDSLDSNAINDREVGEDQLLRKKCKLILKREERKLPWERVVILLLYFVFAATGDIWKGKVECMSVQYWIASLLTIPLVVVVTVIFRFVLVDKNTVKERFGVLLENDVRWTPSNTVKWPLICTSAGVVAGMFGLGGGVIKAPLMLAMNVLPEVSVATSATMIFFTAGTASAVYISFGAIQTDYGISLILFGFVLTFIGQIGMYYLVEKLGRRSYIIFAMATFMIISGALMGIHVIFIYIMNAENDVNWFHFYSLCTSADTS